MMFAGLTMSSVSRKLTWTVVIWSTVSLKSKQRRIAMFRQRWQLRMNCIAVTPSMTRHRWLSLTRLIRPMIWAFTTRHCCGRLYQSRPILARCAFTILTCFPITGFNCIAHLHTSKYILSAKLCGRKWENFSEKWKICVHLSLFSCRVLYLVYTLTSRDITVVNTGVLQH